MARLADKVHIGASACVPMCVSGCSYVRGRMQPDGIVFLIYVKICNTAQYIQHLCILTKNIYQINSKINKGRT